MDVEQPVKGTLKVKELRTDERKLEVNVSDVTIH